MFDVISELNQYSISVDVYDPLINAEKVSQLYKINCIDSPKLASYDVILLAVAHKQFVELGASSLCKFGRVEHIFYDLKSIFDVTESSLRL